MSFFEANDGNLFFIGVCLRVDRNNLQCWQVFADDALCYAQCRDRPGQVNFKGGVSKVQLLTKSVSPSEIWLVFKVSAQVN